MLRAGQVIFFRHLGSSTRIINEPVCNSQNCAVSKFITNSLLDQLVRFHVNTCRGFVYAEDLQRNISYYSTYVSVVFTFQ